MARRKRGRPVHGWLILDKPAGVSSAAAVAKAKWVYDAQKAGHAGTLDPAATGLLALAFGEATKTVPYVTDADKAYRFTVRWGVTTGTDDAEGDVLETSGLRPDRAAILAALPKFTGDIEQVPPQVSAVKIDGRRAYARVRDGEVVEIAPRQLHVARLELIDCPDADTAVFEMTCGKGGYVRSIARDLGAALGCGAHVLTLRRLWSGPFTLDGAMTWEVLERAARGDDLTGWLLPLTVGLAALPEYAVGSGDAARLRNGNSVTLPSLVREPAATVWVSHDGQPLAVGRLELGVFRPERVFVADQPQR